uniref:Myb-like domain-containing protein n=1 Tax=Angiostrongylus cantonensis TaxID=6313 RepID=A0A0K0DB74_ANGCA
MYGCGLVRRSAIRRRGRHVRIRVNAATTRDSPNRNCPSTYAKSSYGHSDQVLAYDSEFLNEIMPLNIAQTWAPFPTPPLSDSENDVYIDDCLDLLYDPDFMTEDRLPLEIHELRSSLDKPLTPLKRTPPTPIPPSTAQPSSSDAAVMSLLQAFHNPTSYTPPPPSHSPTPYSPAEFDQYMQGYSELKNFSGPDNRLSRKERRAPPRQLEQKGRELPRPVSPPPAVREEPDYDGPEWCIIEDQALLTAIRNEEIMCHSFERLKTSLRYNWEYVSGFVNRVTRFYRSPRQCSLRYQTVVRPRESGQLMVVDPLSKKPRKVPLTSAEVVHLRKGRVTTDLQYSHDAGRLREAAVLGKLRLVDSLTVCQNESKDLRRSNDPRPLELGGRLPLAQESRLSFLGVRYATAQYPDEVVNSLEEKRISQEAAKKKLAEQQANSERPSSPPHPVISVCVRPPAVPAGPDIVQSKIPIVIAVPQLVLQNPNAVQSSMTQDLSMSMMPQSHSPVAGLRRVASHPTSNVSMNAGLQHVQGVNSNSQHNYVVVSQDPHPASSRMQFVTRTTDGVTIGQTAQPVYRSISSTTQNKRTPPTTPSLTRVQGSYMANVQTVSGNSTLFQSGAANVGATQRGRVMQRPTAPRMFVQQSNQSGDRPYVVPQQQIRMVSTQRLPPQKRTLGQKSPVTAVVVPSRAVQSPQLRAVPRGFTSQGARIMNVVMAPSGNVTTTSSSQSISLQSGSQPGGGAIISSVASTARHPSPFSETAGVSVKRQLLSQSRQLGTVSRGNSPQTVAQVVIAPLPQPLSGEPPPPAPAVPPLPFTQTQTEELPQRPSSP